MRLALATAALMATTLSGAASASEGCASGLAPTSRVELYFGVAGSTAAWRTFLREVVTPRFPDGFTVLDGSGQWRAPMGVRHERSQILIVYYRRDAESESRIEAIRSLYKARFRQTSVMRADTTACVGF